MAVDLGPSQCGDWSSTGTNETFIIPTSPLIMHRIGFTLESLFHLKERTPTTCLRFSKFKPLEWLDIRYANTTTLTRPDYISLVPLLRSNGRSPATMEWRNNV